MSHAPSSALFSSLMHYRLLESPQLDEVAGSLTSATDKDLARELIHRGWMTPYQINQLLQGRGQELLLGSYVLLERLGEGSSGQVFKARHRAMGRVVALKVLRAALLDNEEAVRRFYREVQVVSRLSHPNIVHAFDAGPLENRHTLVMEYIDGSDLDKLVRRSEPLPAAEACRYISQAALGLQYAHEQGFVHRDVKPSNLLVAAGNERGTGTVKLLDLGLARLRQVGVEHATANITAQAGTPALMGTPAYLSPEQALDFHAADIRSDIYSLGCTLYFALTGAPPFVTNSFAELLLKHQQAEPPCLTSRRADLPAGLANVLQRMCAKRPQERYQVPAEIVAALRPYCDSNYGPAPVSAPPAVPATAAQMSGTEVLDASFPLPGPADAGFTTILGPSSPPGQAARSARYRRLFPVASGLCLVAIVLGFTLLSWRSTRNAVTSLPELDAKPIPVWDLPLEIVANGWGPVEKDRSIGGEVPNDGNVLSLHGTTYGRGLGVHAYSEVIVPLHGRYLQFLAVIGIDDEVRPDVARSDFKASVIFQVWTDGVKRFDSGRLTIDSPPRSVTVDVTGTRELKLIVLDAGDGTTFDHADWADARVVPAKPASSH